MITHALLQKLPPEAWGDGDHYGLVDVSHRWPTRRDREVSCRVPRAPQSRLPRVDDPNRDWDAEFDVAYDEICARHSVCALIPNVEFEIVPIGVNWYPGTRCEIVPQPVGTPDDVVELEADVARNDVLVGQVLSLDSIRST